MIKKFLFVILLLLLIANLSYRIDLRKTHHELIGELMYFPSGFAVRALSLGFYAPLADMVWLRFIQYYGEHRMTDARFDLMYHILDILTTLDPYFVHAYTLGALMLIHDANRPDQAKKILRKGMDSNPNDWHCIFTYGFIHYVFIGNFRVAATYFRLASQQPDAPEYTKRWAAFALYNRVCDLKAALTIWLDVFNNSKDQLERSIAKYYIEKINMMLDIAFLEEKIEIFKKHTGRTPSDLQELVNAGLIKRIPEEPHGHKYKYQLRNDKVISTWQETKRTSSPKTP
jgi:tetratricopeptide (TPR) repeat protein